MSKHEAAIKVGAPGLFGGEEIVAAVVASPRGSGTAGAVGAAGVIGSTWSGKHSGAATGAGLVVERNCGLVLTPTRLGTVRLAISFTGAVKEVKELLSSLPISEIASIDVKRLAAGAVITVVANGNEFKLEGKADGAKNLADAFARMKLLAG
jgi:hypothetical protein